MNNNKKIFDAIAECDRYIAKEGARSADLRPADVQELLNWYHRHRAKLVAMLAPASYPAPVMYADARYELLNTPVGAAVVIGGKSVTRQSAETFKIDALTLVLERALDLLGFKPERSNDAAAMVAEYKEETGCDWSRALAACNCD